MRGGSVIDAEHGALNGSVNDDALPRVHRDEDLECSHCQARSRSPTL